MKITYNDSCLEKRFIDRALYAFDSEGFVRIPGFLNQETIDAMNKIIDGKLAEFEGKNKYSPAKFSFLDCDPAFMDLMSCTFFMEMCVRLHGPWFRFDHAIGLQQPGKIRSSNGTFFSQDDKNGNLHGGPFASQRSCFYGNIDDMPFLGQLVIGVALKKQRSSDGGFCFVPGSHKHGNKTSGGDILKDLFEGNFRDDMIRIPDLDAGDVVIFTESLIHGMAPWSNQGAVRRNLYYKFSPGFLAWRAYDEVSKYENFASNDLQKRLLRPPFVASYDDDDCAVNNNVFREPTYVSKLNTTDVSATGSLMKKVHSMIVGK